MPDRDDFDDLPAYGLREDDFDDRLRQQSVGSLTQAELEEFVRKHFPADEESRPRRRRRVPERHEPDLSKALSGTSMTQTEVSVRLGQYLVSRDLVACNVKLTLCGYELTRRDKPHFPIVEFLGDRGYRREGDSRPVVDDDGYDDESDPADQDHDWRGTYRKDGKRHGIELAWDKLDGHVLTRLNSGQRLVVFTHKGSTLSTKSPAEYTQLRAVIGRAVTWQGAEPDDVIAVCVPRSDRVRKLAAEWRGTQGITRARITILTIDRPGTVYGLPSTK